MSDSHKPKAGGLLDLSTGKPPPPPAPTPRAPVTPDPSVKAGKTLNLSTGKAPRRAPKPTSEALGGGGVVVRETVDLSGHAPPKPPAAPEPASRPDRSGPGSSRSSSSRSDRRGGGKRSDGDRNDSRPRGDQRDDRDGGRGTAPAAASESLGDLLSPEMLAKLRGG